MPDDPGCLHSIKTLSIQRILGSGLTVVNRRLLMISVNRLRVTLAYRGCARRMAVARASSACGAMGGGRGGVTTSVASTSAVPKDAQRLGAGPAMYATARSSESCSWTIQCSAWPDICYVAPAA